MKKFKALLFFIMLIMISQISFGYINIFPTTFDKGIGGNGGYQEFTLANSTTMPIRYRMEAVEFKKDVKTIKDMSKWVEIYPKVLTIDPASQGTFKVYIKSPKGSENGDYGAYLNIRQVNVPQLSGDGKEDLTVGVAVRTNLNMGIYGYVGSEKPDIKFENLKVEKKGEKLYLKGSMENIGNRMGRVSLEAKGGRRLNYAIGEIRVFKGQKLDLDLEIKGAKDNEKVETIIVKDKEKDVLLKELNIKK